MCEDDKLYVGYFRFSPIIVGLDNTSTSHSIYLYCQSGNRSGKASKMLAALGFTKIYDLKGGYSGWKSNN